VIDHFSAQDLAEDTPTETLTQWLARRLCITTGEARDRLAAMQAARAAMVDEQAQGRAAA
jgi:hypothetical protein